MTAYTGTIGNKKDLVGTGNDWWTLSGSGTDEYYYNVEDLSAESDTLFEDGSEMTEGTLGTLAAGEFAIGDNDTIGHDTIYVRLTDDTDPDTKAAEFVQVNQWAHTLFIAFLKEICEAESWVTDRYDVSTENKELIMHAPGYSGTDEIYCGFYSYQDEAEDYYNFCCATMKGYVSGNNFVNQPGIKYSGVPAHNQSITYWISVNGGRLNGCIKVGTPVYMHFGCGNFLPFSPPNQWPQPLFNAGMLPQNTMPDTRFSNTSIQMPWVAVGGKYNFHIHLNSGEWQGNDHYQYAHTIRILESLTRPTNNVYSVMPLYIGSSYPGTNRNIYGELDGIYYITGFDNVVENTLVIDGDTYVVLQDVYRTGFDDYIAMKLV